jgi:hypothetical protein
VNIVKYFSDDKSKRMRGPGPVLWQVWRREEEHVGCQSVNLNVRDHWKVSAEMEG